MDAKQLILSAFARFRKYLKCACALFFYPESFTCQVLCDKAFHNAESSCRFGPVI